MSLGGTFPVDLTKVSTFPKCLVGIGGFGGIDAIGGFGRHKKATATLRRRG